MADFDIGSATPTGSLDGSERIPILKNDKPDVVTTDTVHEYSRNLINSAVFTAFANGGSYTVPSNITKLYNTSSTPIGTFTINLPIASYNGQTIQIASNALVSNLTVNPGSGQTLSTFPIEIKANTSFFLTFNDTNDTWYWNESIPSVGNEIYTETFTGNGSDTIFVLTNIPVSEDYTNVYVNGVYQEKSTYTLSGITLTFSVAPPSGTSIEVVVFTAVTHTRLADAVNSSEAFASILSDASLGYIYESIAEVIADPLVEVGSYADVIEDGRHYRVKKTGVGTAEIRAEYLTEATDVAILSELASTDSGKGAGLVGFAQSGTGAVSRTVQDKLRETISVKDFGATGDGVTDDGGAIIAALNFALSSSSLIYPRAVYFPTGIYRVTTNGVLSSFTQNGQIGLVCYGDGKQSSIIMVDPPSTSDVWVYDNGSNDKMQQAAFYNLGFVGKNASTGTPENSSATYADISQYAKGFRLNNANASLHEGRFHFYDCWFGLLETAVEFSGVGVGTGGLSDECSFVSCQFNQIRGPVVVSNNNQAIANNFVNCVFSRTYSDVFYLTGNGGGPWTLTACSFIMTPDSATSPAMSYIINQNATGSAQNNTPFLFSGGVAEIRGTYGAIVKATASSTLAVVFKAFRFLNTSSASKEVVTIIGNKDVKFDDCVFVNNTATGHQQFKLNAAAGGNTGTITFIDCFYPESRTDGVIDNDLSDNCFVSGGFGVITAIRTRGGNETTGTSEPAINSQDFTLGGSASSKWLTGHTRPTITLHAIQCKRSSLFPEINSSVSVPARESTVRLPKDAIIKNIYVRMDSQAYTSTVTDFQLRVTNNDGSVIHGSSTAARRDALHNISITDLFYDVGGTENERILRLDCVGTGTDETDRASGFWVIEYY